MELHAVGLKEQSSFSIVRQLPVDRLGNVNIVTTNGLNSSRAISCLNGGVREGAGNQAIGVVFAKVLDKNILHIHISGIPEGIFLKKKRRRLTLSEGPVGQQNDVTIVSDSRDVAGTVNGIHSVEDLEGCSPNFHKFSHQSHGYRRKVGQTYLPWSER